MREFAKPQYQVNVGFIAAEEAEKGMAEMSKVYDETGRELLYIGQGDREHDLGHKMAFRGAHLEAH